jgi:hypothetical protein
MPLNETQDAVMCEVANDHLINVLAIHAITPDKDEVTEEVIGSRIILSSGAHLHVAGPKPHEIVDRVMQTLREAQAMILGRIDQSD